MKKEKKIEIESEVFRKLVAHFRKKTSVQNIDLMNLAGFCRNCLSKWYLQVAKKKGVKINYEQAKKIISDTYQDLGQGLMDIIYELERDN